MQRMPTVADWLCTPIFRLTLWDLVNLKNNVLWWKLCWVNRVQSVKRSTKVFPATKASESWGSTRMNFESSCLPSCSSTATKPWWPCWPVTSTSRVLPVMFTSPGLGKQDLCQSDEPGMIKTLTGVQEGHFWSPVESFCLCWCWHRA